MVLISYGEAIITFDKPDNLVEMFEIAAKTHPNNNFIGEKDANGVYQYMTYKESAERIDNLRGGLASLGVKKGDTVGIIANNRKEWFICENATHGLGAIFVPMYEKELVSMWEYVVKDSAIKVLIVSKPEIYEKIKDFKGRIPTLQHFIIIDKDGEGSMKALEEVGKANPVEKVYPAPTDYANILYTSGTTGEPKGVILTHGNFTSNVQAAKKQMPFFNEKSRTLSMLPWAHSFGITADLHAFMSDGASLGLMGSVDTLLEDIVKVKPTFLISVPRVFNKVYNGVWKKMRDAGGKKLHLFETALKLAEQKRLTGKSSFKLKILDKLVFGKIRKLFGGQIQAAVTGSAVMKKEIANFFIDIGIPTYDCYGLTETSPALTMNSPVVGNRLGTVGKPIEKTKIVIDRSRTGDDSPDGEIIAFGPQIMVGYHNKPEKTKDVIVYDENGIKGFRTGDRGRLDDDGYLIITGRFKEEYKLENGKYVHPEAIENETKLLPYIANIMIYGDGKPYNVGLVILDFKVLDQFAKQLGISVTADELFDPSNPAGQKAKELLSLDIQNHLRKTFGGYEIPKKFLFIKEDFSVENGMLTQTLKLKRSKVMEKYGQQLLDLYKD